jgi:Caspase domain
MFRSRLFVSIVFLFSSLVASAQTPSRTARPAYESPASIRFVLPGSDGKENEIYSESHALAIIQSNYVLGDHFRIDHSIANKSEELIKKALQKLGFHVIVYRDLDSSTMSSTISAFFGKYGYNETARLFFYYYGHGISIPGESDPNQRTFLIPVDAVDESKDEQKFKEQAFPIEQIATWGDHITVKHAFFALEACRAGDLLKFVRPPLTLGPAESNAVTSSEQFSNGYVVGEGMGRQSRQYLTANRPGYDIKQNGWFTKVLADALTFKVNPNGYILGDTVISYVRRTVPNYATDEEPDANFTGLGNMLFGVSGSLTKDAGQSNIPTPTDTTNGKGDSSVCNVFGTYRPTTNAHRAISKRISQDDVLAGNYLTVNFKTKDCAPESLINNCGVREPKIYLLKGWDIEDRQSINITAASINAGVRSSQTAVRDHPSNADWDAAVDDICGPEFSKSAAQAQVQLSKALDEGRYSVIFSYNKQQPQQTSFQFEVVNAHGGDISNGRAAGEHAPSVIYARPKRVGGSGRNSNND